MLIDSEHAHGASGPASIHTVQEGEVHTSASPANFSAPRSLPSPPVTSGPGPDESVDPVQLQRWAQLRLRNDFDPRPVPSLNVNAPAPPSPPPYPFPLPSIAPPVSPFRSQPQPPSTLPIYHSFVHHHHTYGPSEAIDEAGEDEDVVLDIGPHSQFSSDSDSKPLPPIPQL